MTTKFRSAAPAILLAVAAGALFLLEKRKPLRRQSEDEPQRLVRNLALGAMSMTVVALLQRPIVEPLAQTVRSRRLGLVNRLATRMWVRDLLSVLALDYTIYLWHRATHQIPFLWRFHRVHHADLDMDMSTALRFHFAEMAMSVPFRALQVRMIGVSPDALRIWQRLFFVSVLFHHSNIRLPASAERLLSAIIVTPRMHSIHHSTNPVEANSNLSSGLSIWDLLHRSFRFDTARDTVEIGVAGLRSEKDVRLLASLALPFRKSRPRP